jgi:hypothetical protein
MSAATKYAVNINLLNSIKITKTAYKTYVVNALSSMRKNSTASTANKYILRPATTAKNGYSATSVVDGCTLNVQTYSSITSTLISTAFAVGK